MAFAPICRRWRTADSLTTRLCHWGLRRWGASLPGKAAAVPTALAGGAALALGGVAAAWYGAGVAGFALLALAALALELAGSIARLQRGHARLRRLLPAMRRVIDAGLLACGYLGVEGRWFRQLFPALVLVLGLNLPATGGQARWWHAVLADRALVAGVVAVMALVTSPEVAVMLAASLLLAAKVLPQRG